MGMEIVECHSNGMPSVGWVVGSEMVGWKVGDSPMQVVLEPDHGSELSSDCG